MATDFDTLTIPVFPGINDLPTAPTASKAGNGAHVIDIINKLIAKLSLQPVSSNNNWNIITTDATLEINSKNLLTRDGVETIALTFPGDPSIGSYVTLIKGHDETLICNLLLSPQIKNLGNGEITLSTSFEEVTLIWLGVNFGWCPTRNNVFTVIQNPQ